MMGLPKGTFKGLARTLSPLSFWMAAGWFAYPRLMGMITDAAGEAVNMDELEMFSLAMTIACIAAGIGLAVYGFMGKDADDAEIRALGKIPDLCPYCGAVLPEGAGHCPGCQNKVLK